jgi:hypothetical protein
MNEVHTDKPNGARRCPQCGAAFTCGMAAGVSSDDVRCWCFDLPLVMAVRADSACLCPACLGRAIRQVQKNQEVQQ